MILAIDTSTALTSVSVSDGDDVVVEFAHLDARAHAEVLAPMLRDVLARVGRAAIGAVAVGVGPGPYTGLRVGLATATAVSAAWSVPAFGLCSLDAIAEEELVNQPSTGFGVATDARRHEVYWSWYDSRGSRQDGPRVSRPEEIDPHVRAGRWIGAMDSLPGDDQVFPRASWVGRRVHRLILAGAALSTSQVALSVHGQDGSETSDALRGQDLLPVRPLYLRRPDASPPARP